MSRQSRSGWAGLNLRQDSCTRGSGLGSNCVKPVLLLCMGVISMSCLPPAGFGARAKTERAGPNAASEFRHSPTELLASHLLSRLTFGATPRGVDLLVAEGLDTWIERQLRADGSDLDSMALAALRGCDAWTQPVSQVAEYLSQVELVGDTNPGMRRSPRTVVGSFIGLIPLDSANALGAIGRPYYDNSQLLACRLARMEAADNQLLEVMTDFWLNHFSVDARRLPSRGSLVEWERSTIRAHALGRFRDLLGAVAKSPAMLSYLDNAVNAVEPGRTSLADMTGGSDSARSRQRGGNHNFARELLELHTLGADSAFLEADVINVARAFTGWTHSHATNTFVAPRSGRPVFVFDSAAHDAESKVILGHVLQAGRGLEDGDDVLDLLVVDPATSHTIAKKLAVRFVSDSPSPHLVARLAAVFRQSEGDIRAVLTALFSSDEFRSPDVFRAKVKSPLEFVLSIRRGLGVPVDTSAEVIDALIALDQPPFQRESPEGWPESGSAWMSVGAMQSRLSLVSRIVAGQLASVPLERSQLWLELQDMPFQEQLTRVIGTLLGGVASSETRAALEAVGAQAVAGEDVGWEGQRTETSNLRLRALLSLAMSSPEFQRR